MVGAAKTPPIATTTTTGPIPHVQLFEINLYRIKYLTYLMANTGAQTAHYLYKVYQGVKIGLAVADMCTTLVEVFQTVDITARKKMLEALLKKHQEEFETMRKAGQLMEALNGTSLRTQIDKAKTSSIQNWSTIAMELDRNTQILIKIANSMQDRRKGIEEQVTIGGKGWLNLAIQLGATGLSAYMLSKTVPSAWKKIRIPNPYKGANLDVARQLSQENPVRRMNAQRFETDLQKWKNRAYTGLKWTGKLAARGVQVLKVIMSIYTIIQNKNAIDGLKQQYDKLKAYYVGEDQKQSFEKDIISVSQSLLNVALELDYLHFASIAIIKDFNKIFTLQYSLAISKPERFRKLAEEYDPQKLQFGAEVCDEASENAKKMENIQNDENLEKKDKLNKLYQTLKDYLKKSNPKNRIVDFTVKLSKDISRFIEHEEIWEKHDTFLTFHEKTLKVVDDFNENNKPIKNQEAVLDAGEQAYNTVQKNLTGGEKKEYLELLHHKQNLEDSQFDRLLDLRQKAKIVQKDEIKINKYLQKIIGRDKVHQEVLDKVIRDYKNIFCIKELHHEDKEKIARQLINFFDQFYATDPTGTSIYGVCIDDFKSKETYKQSFQKMESRGGIIPVYMDQKINVKQFEETYEKEVPKTKRDQFDKVEVKLRFLRTSYRSVTVTKKDETKAKDLILSVSTGWRVKAWQKGDYQYFYLQKNREQTHWKFRAEAELMEEERNTQKQAQKNEEQSASKPI